MTTFLQKIRDTWDNYKAAKIIGSGVIGGSVGAAAAEAFFSPTQTVVVQEAQPAEFGYITGNKTVTVKKGQNPTNIVMGELGCGPQEAARYLIRHPEVNNQFMPDKGAMNNGKYTQGLKDNLGDTAIPGQAVTLEDVPSAEKYEKKPAVPEKTEEKKTHNWFWGLLAGVGLGGLAGAGLKKRQKRRKERKREKYFSIYGIDKKSLKDDTSDTIYKSGVKTLMKQGKSLDEAREKTLEKRDYLAQAYAGDIEDGDKFTMKDMKKSFRSIGAETTDDALKYVADAFKEGKVRKINRRYNAKLGEKIGVNEYVKEEMGSRTLKDIHSDLSERMNISYSTVRKIASQYR